MECYSCGFTNGAGALYCASCGESMSQSKNPRVCPECGEPMQAETAYCGSCGRQLTFSPLPSRSQGSRRKRDSDRQKGNRKTVAGTALPSATKVLLASAAIGLVVYLAQRDNTSNGERPVQDIRPARTNSIVDARVLSIASNFICSCGSCGEQPLESCTCETAVQERDFVRRLLEDGRSESEVVVAVSARFGWPKPERRERIDSLVAAGDAGTIPSGKGRSGTAMSSLQSAEASLRIATVFDKREILSRFECPCGQCNIRELQECECAHPGGAKEVKAFVDNLIAANESSVLQIVQAVDDKYQSRKF